MASPKILPSDRLTIVVVNDYGHVNGGAGQVAFASARELARRGHDVRLFCAVPPVEPTLEADGVRVVCTGQPDILLNPNRLQAAYQGIWNRPAAAAMADLLRPLDPRRTVVHLHGWTKALSSSIVPEILRHGAGLLATLHDYFLACPNGGFFNYVAERSCTLSPLSTACLLSNCDPRGRAQKLWRTTRHYVQSHQGQLPNGVRHFIAISDFSYNIIAPYLPDNASIYRISNPIESERVSCADVGRNTRYVVVGRLTREKGPFLAAEAARRAGVELEFVGDGYLRQEITTRYPEHGVTGWLPHEKLVRRLDGSRALVFPSLWYETFGLVVLEAAACGVPAIVPDASAVRDSVVQGETGLCFRSGDVEDLVRKIRQFQDPELASRLGRAAYERFWSSPPTPAAHVDQLEQCYRKVLQA